ncbi:Cytochrome c family protein [hydrothermal vent metagenome]|uniref:Cytochrome c family protein n=1 Tax=hydrothermal vent metagenome TaxID=652676 RepID=A0A3B0SCK7_9ZZZZ
MKSNKNKIILVVAAAAIAYFLFFMPNKSAPIQTADIKIPKLSLTAKKGKLAFENNCISCHGENAAGTDNGPPLVHDIYNPGHHADMAFYRAAKMGTKQHHWTFGDMPSQNQVSKNDVTRIIKYIRELQEANGIVFKEHRM